MNQEIIPTPQLTNYHGNTKVVYACKKNKYFIFEDKISFMSPYKFETEKATHDGGETPISLVSSDEDELFYLSGNDPLEMDLYRNNVKLNIPVQDPSTESMPFSCAFYQKNFLITIREKVFEDKFYSIVGFYETNGEEIQVLKIKIITEKGEEGIPLKQFKFEGSIYKILKYDSKLVFLYKQQESGTPKYYIALCHNYRELIDQSEENLKKCFIHIDSPHGGKINDARFSPKGDFLLTCGCDGSVKKLIFDDQKLNSILSAVLSNSPVLSVRPNPYFNSVFVAAGSDGFLYVSSFDASQSKRIVYTASLDASEFKAKDTADQDSDKFVSPAVWADFSPNDPYAVVAASLFDIKTYYISRF